ncbi:MAG: flagellar export chaperone FliS [Pedosphaera sp.]|nr:flagellar export chaperone FliS [Pedosphaera sp.]
MPPPLNPWQSYRKAGTQTASPGQLVLMLYDGAIRFLERSLQGFELEDPSELNSAINNNIIRAQEIIRELDYSLNMEIGGEFSATMDRLYLYFDSELTRSNMQKESEGIQTIIRLITGLRDAWFEMVSKGSSNNSVAELETATA